MNPHLQQLTTSLDFRLKPNAIKVPTKTDCGKRAAVLILITNEAEPRVTLTERGAELKDHAGQISFPGGQVEKQDSCIVATALRESEEEIGLNCPQVRIIGTLAPIKVPVSGFAVTPVVAIWPAGKTLFPADSFEVAAIHEIEMSRLADPVNRVSARHPNGHIGPAFKFDELFIWGFTAQLLSLIIDLGGWSREWDLARIVDIPVKFLQDIKSIN